MITMRIDLFQGTTYRGSLLARADFATPPAVGHTFYPAAFGKVIYEAAGPLQITAIEQAPQLKWETSESEAMVIARASLRAELTAPQIEELEAEGWNFMPG